MHNSLFLSPPLAHLLDGSWYDILDSLNIHLSTLCIRQLWAIIIWFSFIFLILASNIYISMMAAIIFILVWQRKQSDASFFFYLFFAMSHHHLAFIHLVDFIFPSFCNNKNFLINRSSNNNFVHIVNSSKYVAFGLEPLSKGETHLQVVARVGCHEVVKKIKKMSLILPYYFKKKKNTSYSKKKS